MFAIFCGLLIILDYMMCVLLVFPALCVYDRARHNNNCCLSCNCCGAKKKEEQTVGNNAEPSDVDKTSFIRRILSAFYNGLHSIRWALFVVCIAGLAVCAYYASTMELPATSDVRLLDPDKFQYEKNFQWRANLLYDALEKSAGSQTTVMWGVTPADNGDYNNPQSFSTLVLDDTFDPSSTESQSFLLGFCDKMFDEDFAKKPDQDYQCPINRFNDWLQENSIRSQEEQSLAYVSYCNGATEVPMAQDDFHACISGWADEIGELNVLSRENKVQIMYVQFTTKIRFDSPYTEIDDEWHLIEKWMNDLGATAPDEVSNFFFSSEHFWW